MNVSVTALKLTPPPHVDVGQRGQIEWARVSADEPSQFHLYVKSESGESIGALMILASVAPMGGIITIPFTQQG